MLREHTSLTFTQNIIADHQQFSLAVETLCKISRSAQTGVFDYRGGGCGISRRRFLQCKRSTNSASVKMALANVWKTQRTEMEADDS